MYQLGKVKITSTKDTINPNTKMSMLLVAPPGFGKTQLASSLHKMTMKFFNKPILYIATELGEGGGAVTLRDLDIPLVTPANYNELSEILANLKGDRTFGGVVYDNATEGVQRYVKPYALSFPNNKDKQPTRAVGVPGRNDYQTMGEITRQIFQQLLNLTTDSNPDIRKHLVITSTLKESHDDDGKITAIGPELPGAMADAAAAMMQTVCEIVIKPQVVDGKRVNKRVLVSAGDGVRRWKDRFKILPAELRLKDVNNPQDDEYDLCDIWERLWLPVMSV